MADAFTFYLYGFIHHQEHAFFSRHEFGAENAFSSFRVQTWAVIGQEIGLSIYRTPGC
jgi:hypothetical protein